MSGINIGVDPTDHFFLYCPKCKSPMSVKNAENLTNKEHEKTTRIFAQCSCGFEGQRKIYWNNTADKNVCSKTDIR